MTNQQARRKRNQILSWLINLAGILVFALILHLGGVEAWQQIIHGDWRYILAAFAVTLLWNVVAAYRWSIIANEVIDFQEPCPYRYYFTYHMIGMLIGQVVPVTVGMLGGRPVALSLSRSVSLKRAALSVFLDKLFDLILAVLLVTPVALYLVGWISLPLALGAMGAIALAGLLLVIWQYERALQLVGRVGSRVAQPLTHVPVIGRRLIHRLPQQLERLSTNTFLSNRLAARSFLLTLLLYSLLSARLYFISQALRLDIPWYILSMGVSVTQLALIFAVTPGSLGFLEGGWAAVLGLAGLSREQFTIFVIGRRAYVLIFTLINTLLAFAWIRQSPAGLFRAVLRASRQPVEDPGASMPGSAGESVQSPVEDNPIQSEAQNGSPSLVVK